MQARTQCNLPEHCIAYALAFESGQIRRYAVQHAEGDDEKSPPKAQGKAGQRSIVRLSCTRTMASSAAARCGAEDRTSNTENTPCKARELLELMGCSQSQRLKADGALDFDGVRFERRAHARHSGLRLGKRYGFISRLLREEIRHEMYSHLSSTNSSALRSARTGSAIGHVPHESSGTTTA